MAEKKTIALFDFDGTITTRDSLLPFLIFTKGPFKTFLKLSLLIPYFIRYGLNLLTRQQMKEKVLTSFFKGMSLEDLQEWGIRFAATHLDQMVRPKAWERIKWHQDQGHSCLLVSASLDIYLAPWAKRHHFDAALTSSLAVNHKGMVSGKLKGLNCWGPEKERRVVEHLGSIQDYIIYVYGDSRGDAEILNLAHYPFYRNL